MKHNLQQDTPWGQQGNTFFKKCIHVKNKLVLCKLEPSVPSGLEIDQQSACASVAGVMLSLIVLRLRRGAKSKVAQKWTRWLHNPCPLGGPHRFRAGGRIRGGPQVGKVAT